MAVTKITTDIPAQVGSDARCRLMRIVCTDDIDTITTAGYLNSGNLEGYTVVDYDFFHVYYGADSTSFGIFSVSVADDGEVTLTETPLPANTVTVSGATVVDNAPKFSSTSGEITDAGYKILSGTTGTYAGGGTSNAFSVTGLSVGAKGSAVIRASTNAVSICKAVPGTNTLTITFSADPGASTTVDYIYTTAAAS